MASSHNSFECLVLSGGGGKGAYGAGVANCLLKYRRMKDVKSNLCHIGTSVGALNACMLAAGKADELTKLWKEMKPSRILGLCNRPWFRVPWAFVSPFGWVSKFFCWITGSQQSFYIYSNKSLRTTISAHINDSSFKEISEYGHLIVCATNLSKGCVEAFYISKAIDTLVVEDSRKTIENQRLGHFRKIKDAGMLVEVLLASSAIPLVFPPVRIGDDLYIDGGVTNNTPTSEAAQFLRHAREYLESSVGKVYCVLLDPIGTNSGITMSLSFWDLMMRTYDVFFFSQTGQSLRSWHQISHNVKKNADNVNQFRQAVKGMALPDNNKKKILEEFESRFSGLRGSTKRLEIDLIEIQPSALVGKTFDFSRKTATEAFRHGYNDCAKSLRDKGLFSPAECEKCLSMFNDPVS